MKPLPVQTRSAQVEECSCQVATIDDLAPFCTHLFFNSFFFFFNEKRYYVNLWLQPYYFFPRTPLLFSLAFVYTNRVIYLGFLINLFFSLCMYVYRIGELSGYGSEHGHRQIKSKQHRLGSVLHVLHRMGGGDITPYTPSSLRTNSPYLLSIPLSGAHCHMDQQTIPGSWQLIMYPTNIC